MGAVETFAFSLEQDAAAIRAALVTPWSSGHCEGQINKLKLLKRQTYGRASSGAPHLVHSQRVVAHQQVNVAAGV